MKILHLISETLDSFYSKKQRRNHKYMDFFVLSVLAEVLDRGMHEDEAASILNGKLVEVYGEPSVAWNAISSLFHELNFKHVS